MEDTAIMNQGTGSWIETRVRSLARGIMQLHFSRAGNRPQHQDISHRRFWLILHRVYYASS